MHVHRSTICVCVVAVCMGEIIYLRFREECTEVDEVLNQLAVGTLTVLASVGDMVCVGITWVG